MVAVEARKAAQLRGASPTTAAPATDPAAAVLPVAPPARERVASLTERRLTDARASAGELPADGRALPDIARYDELLARPSADGTHGAP